MKKITLTLSVIALLVSGCSNSTKEAKVVTETKPVAAQPDTKAPAQKPEATAKTAPNTTQAPMPHDAVHQAAKTPKAAPLPVLSKFYEVFKDGAQIAPKSGKPMLLVFGQPADAYTQKLQADITDNPSLAKMIQDTVTPIYINAAAEKRHKFLHNGEMMEVDTKTLVSIYQLTATPTIIFTDEKSQSVFVVPGYMPPKQFEVTLQFFKEGAWKGKDRKNGEVYQALKAYYDAHGIQVGKAKK